jgi:hypothetical protein
MLNYHVLDSSPIETSIRQFSILPFSSHPLFSKVDQQIEAFAQSLIISGAWIVKRSASPPVTARRLLFTLGCLRHWPGLSFWRRFNIPATTEIVWFLRLHAKRAATNTSTVYTGNGGIIQRSDSYLRTVAVHCDRFCLMSSSPGGAERGESLLRQSRDALKRRAMLFASDLTTQSSF